jgi:small subunit ribosomal protein S14
MATKAQVQKSNRKPKFSSRIQTRCQLCGRPRAVYRKFRVCRICLRNLAHEGKVPGLKKASW